MTEWLDPIVEELRAIPREIAREAGNDLERLYAKARAWESAHPERMGTPGEEPSRPIADGVDDDESLESAE